MSYRIAITGSTGMIGTAVSDFFRRQGHPISRIIRKETKIDTDDNVIVWDIPSGVINATELEGHEVVIHFAGANISQKWTAAHKRMLYCSRIDSTKLLANALAGLKNKPKLFLSASAIGFYGPHQSHENVDERTPLGHDYLAQICQHWEAATKEAQEAGIRVILMRTGVVLSNTGGALAQMLPIFKSGLGGKISSGKQMMSWIALDEIPMIINHMIEHEDISGPVNVVAPQPVSNKEFTRALGRVIKRPVIFPVPAFGIKMMFGEMGETLLLKGAKILPKRLNDTNYHFQYENVEKALKSCLL